MKTAMIFAAGFGKRLQPLTFTTPKPLLLVGNESCLERSIQALLKFGIQRIIVNTHYLPNAFTEIFKKYQDVVISSHEPEILETGGGVKQVLPYFDDTILCINGDVWFEDYNFLTSLVKRYDARSSDAHLLLIPQENILFGDYLGDYAIVGDGHLLHRENLKTAPEYVYGGAQVLNKVALEKFAKDKIVFSLRAFYDFCEEQKRLTGQSYQKKWCDIGTLDVYQKINDYCGV